MDSIDRTGTAFSAGCSASSAEKAATRCSACASEAAVSRAFAMSSFNALLSIVPPVKACSHSKSGTAKVNERLNTRAAEALGPFWREPPGGVIPDGLCSSSRGSGFVFRAGGSQRACCGEKLTSESLTRGRQASCRRTGRLAVHYDPKLPEDELLMPAVFTVIGLVLNLVGVILLFRYGMPYRVRTEGNIGRIIQQKDEGAKALEVE
jgi:hypothetical protein